MLIEAGIVSSEPLAADAPSKLNVLRHDGDSLGVDCAQVRVFKQADHVALRCFLNRQDGLRLEAQVRLHLLSNLTDKPLEGQLAEQELSRLLELANLAEGNSAWSEPVRLLDTALGLYGGCLARSLVGQLLPRCLRARVLAGGLLGACHFVILFFDIANYVIEEQLPF